LIDKPTIVKGSFSAILKTNIDIKAAPNAANIAVAIDNFRIKYNIAIIVMVAINNNKGALM
jgi:hypothetical protein